MIIGYDNGFKFCLEVLETVCAHDFLCMWNSGSLIRFKAKVNEPNNNLWPVTHEKHARITNHALATMSSDQSVFRTNAQQSVLPQQPITPWQQHLATNYSSAIKGKKSVFSFFLLDILKTDAAASPDYSLQTARGSSTFFRVSSHFRTRTLDCKVKWNLLWTVYVTGGEPGDLSLQKLY